MLIKKTDNQKLILKIWDGATYRVYSFYELPEMNN